MTTATLSAAEAACAASGSWSGNGAADVFGGVYTDSRLDGHGKLFLALKGERFDGHDFLEAAVRSGCAGVCVDADHSDAARKFGVPVLTVQETLTAYQGLARAFRRKFPRLKVVAVTGSVGKTSVKEMLRAVLTESSAPEKVLATEGNTNNQIGVPQNLFRLTPDHEYAVIEMGTSAPGEIAPLSRTAEPDVALVNSIAPCHLEKLIDLAGVAREKASVADALAVGGTAILPFDAPEKSVLAECWHGKKILSFGDDPACAIRSEYLGGDLGKSKFRLRFPDGTVHTVEWMLGGAHQARNAAGAAAAAWAFGIDAGTICRGLPKTRLPGMRMKRTVFDGVVYLNDAYNANPASMKATLAQLAASGIDARKLVLVLGGMRELGTFSEAAHREIAALAAELFPAGRIVTVGEEFAALPAYRHFADSESGDLHSLVREGDLVFLKGSRGIALEKLIPPEAR
ncbi:MAG: UDP-N-acetylmuramoyl-tripeptide--D-alanyl-D-alanine ligase [Victivallaceae bacterium]|nr:UDP-N-acetylmuramoyl-tripeptide--D-alanyl-D-alanine ligase [Victivallaceae bacterium]